MEIYDNRCPTNCSALISLYTACILKNPRLKNVSNFVVPLVYTLKMVIMGNICYLPTICLSTRNFTSVFWFESYNSLTIITILQIKSLNFQRGSFAQGYTESNNCCKRIYPIYWYRPHHFNSVNGQYTHKTVINTQHAHRA